MFQALGNSVRQFGKRWLMSAGLSALFLITLSQSASACPIYLKASWFSIASLKKEGTYKHSKGVCADGSIFNDNLMVCACRLYPLGSILRVTNLDSDRSVIVRVADRIGKRFATKRIDLSKMVFSRIAELREGVIPVRVEVLK